MMKYFFTIIYISILMSCTNNASEKNKEQVLKDYTIQPEKNDKVNVSEFYIAPPDSNYTGSVQEKYPNGIVKYKGFYRFGKRHGLWIYFYSNGMLWSECEYDKGIRNGRNQVYFPNGKTHYVSFYKYEKKDSVWSYFDTSGVLIKKIYFKNDNPVKTESF